MFEDIEELESESIEIIDNVEIVRCNAYQIDVANDCLIIQFGRARQLSEDRDEVNVLAKVAFPLDNLYLSFLFDLYREGREYEEESGNIVFPRTDMDENELVDETIDDSE